MGPTVRIIVNGKSAGSPLLRRAVEDWRQGSVVVDVRVTWERGDAPRFVREACQDQVDRIIAAGGDGTLREIVNTLVRCDCGAGRPALGLIPMGTANDFAKSCNLPLQVPEAMDLAVTGAVVPIDLVRINDQYLINVATSGFGAEVTAATPPELKRFLGGASYALMGMLLSLNLQPHEGEIVLPGSERRKASVLVGAVGNGRQAGGGLPLTPRACLDDGLLDLLYVRHFPLTDLGTVVQELASLPADGRYVGYNQVPWFTFDHPRPINVNLDGETCVLKKGRAEVVPGVLRFVLPANCPLLLHNSVQVQDRI